MPDPLLDETLQDRRRTTPTANGLLAPHLFVALECGAPLRGPSRHSLANIDEVIIGRGAERAVERAVEGGIRRLVLRVADPRMSARHARLQRQDTAWVFQDLDSTNGSRVDGAAVSSGPIEDRALLELGHSVFLFRSDLPTRPETAGDVARDDLRGVAGAFVTLIPSLAAAFDTLARIAKSNVPVLLQGETGSGKELLARAIHAESGRSGEFVAINCGAIPDDMVEAQLFGHVEGASAAGRVERGYLRAAHAGTLFLDEIGELPQSLQAALLRVLQENEIVPVGSTRPVAVDVRVVTATHAPIDALVQSGAFRNDLFARIAGFRFVAPPLRDRIEDLGLLLANVLQELAPGSATPWKVEPAAAFALFSYDWPRNIRELKQCLASAAVLGGYRSIELANLSQALIESRAPSRRPSAGPPAGGQRSAQLDEQLRSELIALFTECKGNVSEVARRMGKARVQIQRWLRRFAIDPTTFRD